MAQARVYTESVITLNGQQANQTMQALQNQADNLRQKMLQATKLGDIEGAKELQKQLDACNKSMTAIKRETKDWSDVLNNLNGSTLGELQKAASGLNKQLRNLKPGTQEFIDKSQQLKQVKERMGEIQGKSKEVQNLFGGFFTKIGWAGIVASAFGVFKKLAQDMISSVQAVGDKWNEETAGWKAAYHTFIATLATNDGWGNLISNMKEAYAAGKELAALLDEEFERRNSFMMKESEYSKLLAEQRKIMNDRAASSEERIAAAKEYTRLEQELGEERLKLLEEEMEHRKKAIMDKTQMTDAEIEEIVRFYEKNINVIHQADSYLKNTEKLLEKGYRVSIGLGGALKKVANEVSGSAAQAREELRDLEATTDESVKNIALSWKKYMKGNDNLITPYIEAYKKYYNEQGAAVDRTANAENLIHRLTQKNIENHTKTLKEAYQKEVKASEQHFRELQNQAKQAYAAGKISELAYQLRTTAITKEGWEAKLKLAKKYKEDTTSIIASLLDLEVAERKKIEDLQKSSLKELTDTALQMAATASKEISKEVDEQMKAEVDKLLDWEKKAQEIRYVLDRSQKRKDEFDAEMEELQQLHEAKLLSEEEYQAALLRLQKKYQNRTRAEEGAVWDKRIKEIQSYLSEAGSFINALQSAAAASLDARMEKELAAAGDNAEERARIEEEYEQKKLDLQKKYADVDMGIQIAQALAAAALASVQAWTAAGGNPIAAGIIIALIAATTAAQVATIIAQRNAIKSQTVAKNSSGSGTDVTGARVATGYSEGGFTRSAASDYQEVGVVHANEWVAPAAMVRANPITFARLESQRRSGNYRSGIAGYADGGIAGETGDATMATAVSEQNCEVMTELVQLLREVKASMPFKAYVITSELNKKLEIENSIKSIVSRK